jgi:hypothetical protein
MKTKKNNKKLVFNKSTVAHLDMKKVKGGCLPSDPSCCPSYETDCGDTVVICLCKKPKTDLCTVFPICL